MATVAAAAVLLLGPAPAASQSLLQSLFGFGSNPPPPPRAYAPQSFPMRSAPYFYPSDRDGSGSGRSEGGGSGSYRTVCVRMCDGYYFPISYGVSRSSFSRDARACQASCGAEARLFYHATSDRDGEDMIDLGGRAYSSIPNAFRYRKTLVAGCACKPAPWSEASLTRHRAYAGAAGPADGRGRSELRNPDAAIATAVTDADPAPHSPTAPIERPDPREAVEPAASPAPQGAGHIRVQRAQQATLYRGIAPAMQPAPREAARPLVAALPPAPKTAPLAKAAAKPVYSHDLGRFVFPGERR